MKKLHQHLSFLRSIKSFSMPWNTPTNFHRCTAERILTGCIMLWYGNSNPQKRKRLQRVVDSARSIMGTALSSIKSIYISHSLKKMASVHHSKWQKIASIIKDQHHSGHALFSLLSSGRKLKSYTRFRNGYFSLTTRF